MMQTLLGVWLAGMTLLTTPQAQTELECYEFTQIQMGIPFKFSLYAPDSATANKAAQAAFQRIEQLNAIMSDYDSESELMRLCRRSGPGRSVAVSPDLEFVLCRALAVSRQSQGAFDVTVGPVVRLWRRARRRRQLPDADRLAAARERIGFQHIRLDREAHTVEFLKSGMRLDLGGIAKGYAADQALAVLRQHGIGRAMVDGGGDLVLGDPPPGRNAWRIGIAPLEQADGRPTRFLNLKNCAVATSGDAYQYVEIDGTRYSHIVDPQTGLGLTHRSSVTVIAPDGTTADSLASAVSVLGNERGIHLIDSIKDGAALVMSIQNGHPVTVESKRFSEFASTTKPESDGTSR